MPVLSASALPPFSFRTTTSGRALRGTLTETNRPTTGTSGITTRGTSTRSNASTSRAKVSSVEPSSTTRISNSG